MIMGGGEGGGGQRIVGRRIVGPILRSVAFLTIT